jgi:hypothetical protein
MCVELLLGWQRMMQLHRVGQFVVYELTEMPLTDRSSDRPRTAVDWTEPQTVFTWDLRLWQLTSSYCHDLRAQLTAWDEFTAWMVLATGVAGAKCHARTLSAQIKRRATNQLTGYA